MEGSGAPEWVNLLHLQMRCQLGDKVQVEWHTEPSVDLTGLLSRRGASRKPWWGPVPRKRSCGSKPG